MPTGNLTMYSKTQESLYSVLNCPANKPYFAEHKGNVILNPFMIYLLDEMGTWQNLRILRFNALEPIQDKVKDWYPGSRTEGRAYVTPTPPFSRELFAYIDTLCAMAPYYKLDDDRVNGVFDKVYDDNLKLKIYGTFNYADLHRKLIDKMKHWLEEFPHPDEMDMLPPEDGQNVETHVPVSVEEAMASLDTDNEGEGGEGVGN